MKTLWLLLALIVFSSLGEILAAKGMKQVGDVSFAPRALLGTIARAVRNRILMASIMCLAFSFFAFISLLSYADLSFVIPLTAVTYITNTIGAKLFLHEKISRERVIGILLVAVGVAFVSLPQPTEAALISIISQSAIALFGELSPTVPASFIEWALLIMRSALLICVLAAIIYYGIAIVAGWLWTRDRQRQRALGLSFTPAVTILIPVRGADAEAYENFASFCRQDYSDYQIIFGCREETDPVVPIIRKLQSDFPARDIEIVISANEIGHNAKVSNLHNMYAKARHDYLIVVDSDIRVTADYLRRVVAPLQQPKVGMVTCLYRGANAKTFAALLENIGISSTFGPEVMSSRALEGIKFALGSTIVTRRAVLEKIGGFPAVADYLADDFLLGNYTAAAGYEVVLSDCVVDHISGPDTMNSMLKHQLRWGRSTRISRPKGYAGLILTYGTATSLLLLASLNFSPFGWVMVGATFAIRLLTAFYGGVLLLKDRVLLKYLWLVPVRDLISFGVWVVSFVGKEIQWRGDRFLVLRSGEIKPVSKPRTGTF